ncbi:hypothetical protein C1T31_09765 [Hanstruepera neustonica]|uniref:CHAT domain-containing protein n=1 Tax=Hanstruepera neustonica TaxID=1445657 RepID=A0A2K1DXP0_9FLAO|nr:CHAT domain-containing tetratricopeptide repeat protein [Hanstruepera neustonica]PNQ72788.1 hypothetical protein C1T31_09765 [Hanstruepera neustonica]
MDYLRLLFFCLLPLFGISQESHSLSNTTIADSLDNIGEYDESIKFRKLALDEPNHSTNYKTYLKAKELYTKSCILETRGGRKNILEGLEKSQEAYRLVENIISEDDRKLFFRHLILNRIYHQYGYTGQWKEALIEAKKNYEVLRDTFPEYKTDILYVLDDLGFINNKLDNPEKSNEYYERSFKLYKEYYPENLKDVYLNNNRIINNYRKLGLKNEEFKLLEESENYWTNIYDGEDVFFQRFNFYDKIADWHINYGNKELAESYLFKKEELFDSVANSRKKTEKIALIRRERVNLNESYIKLYLKYKNYNKAKHYIEETKELLRDSIDKYRWNIVSKANLYLTEAKMPDVEFDKAESLFKKALSTVVDNKEKYYVNPIQYQIELFHLYANHHKEEAALEIMDVILDSEEVTDHDRLQLLFKKAILLKDEAHIKEAFSSLLKSPDSSQEFKNLDIKDFHEYYTFEILNGILGVANIYLEWYHTSNKVEYSETAFNLFMLSSKLFERIYKGDAFNDNLYNSFIDIQDGLLHSALLNPSKKNFDRTLEAIENNSSRLTWSKFIYGRNIKVNVPDSLLFKEQKLQSLINYYQVELYEKRNSKTIDLDNLKLRLTDLNNQLRNHQKHISKNYIQYGNSRINLFDIQNFRERLKPDEVVVKYIVSMDEVFVFRITKNDTQFLKIINSEKFNETIGDFIELVSTFNSEVVIPSALSKLIEPVIKSDKKHVTIVSSGMMSLIPFEVLLPNYFESDMVLNYAGSLKLYYEQLDTNHINKKLNVGIFKAQNGNSLNKKGFLPELNEEIEGIKRLVDATDYYMKNSDDFFKHAQSHNVLHFGLHASIDEEIPELSALNFAENDMLIGSLYNTSLQADLAVLSACDTGNGRYVNGEGVQSISKAFTYAGVPSTVMSLWKVDDKATAKLMTSFYKYLNEGKSKSEALKWAKKDYLASDIDSELKHPYYWSGFIVSGNVEPFEVHENQRWWLSLIVLPIIALFFVRKSKFRK